MTSAPVSCIVRRALACAALAIAVTACSDAGDGPDTAAADSSAVPVPAGGTGGVITPAGSQATPDTRGVSTPGAGSTPATGAPATGGADTTAGAQPAGGSEQGDAGARILARAAAKYADVRTMRADFVMNTQNPLLRSNTTSSGRIYQQRPDRIALRFTDPAGDVMLSDGTFFWVYTPSTNRDQVIKAPAASGGARGVDLQAQFLGDPVKRFRHTLHGQEQVQGRTADVITLVPRGDEPFRSLKVWIDREDALARRFEVTERNGVIRRMDLRGLVVNGSVPADVFRFTVPAGVRVLEQ